jgi:hypothetical protein
MVVNNEKLWFKIREGKKREEEIDSLKPINRVKRFAKTFFLTFFLLRGEAYWNDFFNKKPNEFSNRNIYEERVLFDKLEKQEIKKENEKKQEIEVEKPIKVQICKFNDAALEKFDKEKKEKIKTLLIPKFLDKFRYDPLEFVVTFQILCNLVNSEKFGDDELKFLENISDYGKFETMALLSTFYNIVRSEKYQKGMIKNMYFLIEEAENDIKLPIVESNLYDLLWSLSSNEKFSLDWITRENIKKIKEIKRFIVENQKEYKFFTFYTLNVLLKEIPTEKNIDEIFYLTHLNPQSLLILVNSYYEWIRLYRQNLIHDNQYFRKALIYMEAKKKDKSFIADYTYALSFLEESYVELLNKKFNVDYFLRYSKDLLINFLLTATKSDENINKRKLAVVIFNKGDFNGSFYRAGKSLDPLVNYYRVLIYEVSNENEFYEKLKEAYEEYGKISALIIGGHGSLKSISLSLNENEEEKIDVSDVYELERLKGFFDKNAVAVLLSCETGGRDNSIASLLAEKLRLSVYAPKGSAVADKVKIIVGNNGIEDVEYDVGKVLITPKNKD